MANLMHLGEGLNKTWKNLSEEWARFARKAATAITRFTPKTIANEEQAANPSVGWGILAAEIAEDDDKIVVRLEAPGMNRSDFDVEIANGHLIVRGEKKYEQERKEGRYVLSECAYGSFERVLPLPTVVEADKASAHYRDGVLRIEIPKAPQAHRRHFAIEVK